MSTFEARNYQIDDLARLINAPQTGLFHEPGAGKTFIAGMFTQYICDATKQRVVWTQPGGIMDKNRRDILFCTNFAPEEVRIVQGPPAKRLEIMNDPRVKVFLMTATGYANEWELLPSDVKHSIHDEIQLSYITHTAKRTQEWYKACRGKGAIVPMTGTVIRGRLDSAYPILHVIGKMYYGNDREFLQHHAWFDESGKVIGWKNHDRLKEALRRVGIFRSFKEIYGEEQKVIQVERCKVKEPVRKMYEKLETLGLIELTDEFIDANAPGINAIRCRQVLACPEMFECEIQTGKDDVLEVDIEEYIRTGERLAIFSAMTAEQERIIKLIQKHGGSVGHINGTVSNEKRQEIDREFCAGNLQFVVASPATAGIGFNWNFLNNMVFTSVDYMDDSFVQAYRRGIRGKREVPLRIKVLKYEDTVEHRILEIIDRKSRDHALVNPNMEVLTLSQL